MGNAQAVIVPEEKKKEETLEVLLRMVRRDRPLWEEK
jgi:hypothetical protein